LNYNEDKGFSITTNTTGGAAGKKGTISIEYLEKDGGLFNKYNATPYYSTITAAAGSGTDSAQNAGYGLTKTVVGTTRTLKIDTASMFPVIRATIPGSSSTPTFSGPSFAPAASLNPEFIVMASAIVFPTNSYSYASTITWDKLDYTSGHNSSFFTTVAGNSGNQRLTINYPNTKYVINVTITPDESFAVQSLTVGPTVGFSNLEAAVYHAGSMGVRLTGDGAGNWTKNGYDASEFTLTTFSTGDGGTSFNVAGTFAINYDGLNIQYIGPNNYHIKRLYSGLGAYNVKFVLVDEFGNFLNTNPTTSDEVIISNAGMRSYQISMYNYDNSNAFMGSFTNFWVTGLFECWMVANTVSSSSIAVKWQAYTGATNYKIYRATDQAFTSPTLIHTGTDFAYTDTGLSSSTLYYYKMVATISSVDTDITTFSARTK
jgi:hypothetical protein